MNKDTMCPIEYGLDVFGGKWKSRIICVLSFKDNMRYNEIKKYLGNITDAVLASMLKELIFDDMVSRKQYNEIPPKVEYSLTNRGKTVIPILQNICVWSRKQTKNNLSKKLPHCINCPL